jgi:hypothetical protein
MGGRSKSSSTQQSNLDPELRKRQLANIDQASQIAGNLQARQFAGMSSGMTDAMGTARSLTQLTPSQIQAQQVRVGRNIGLPSAMATAQAASQFTPDQIQAQQASLSQNVGLNDALSAARGVSQFTPDQVRAGSFLNKNLQAYMNPYQQAVIDTSLADIERSRQIAAQTGAASAVRARAFGGSRQGVAEAETNRAALEQAARTSAQLRAQGFEAATGLMGQELSLEQQAALANQQAGLAGAQQRLSGAQALYGFGEGQQRLQSQIDLANQQTALQAAQANQQASISGVQQRLSAAQQMFGMGESQQRLGLQAGQLNQAAALQAAQANQSAELQAAQQRAAAATQLYGMGSQEQQLEQARLDAERNLELERQQIRNQALGLNVGGGSGMQTTGSSRSSSFNISNPFGG